MAPRKNKIDVALDLQQQAISKLEQFNKDFGNTVTRLAGLIENVPGAQQGQGQGGAGQLGPNASIGPGSMFVGVTPARQGGQPSDWNSAAILNKPAGGPSLTDDPNEYERQIIEAQRRVMGEGAIPTSFRQALGYYSAGQLGLNPLSPFSNRDPNAENPTPFDQFGFSIGQFRTNGAYRRNMAERANQAIFNMQATKALAMNAMGKYSGFFGSVQAIGNSGYDVNANASRSGFMGSQLFSGSFWHGLSENVWRPAISSDFGLDPSYGFGQAQQARQAINSYGWGSGNEGNWLANVLKQNTVNYGLDPQTQMAFLDPMLRWGGTSFQDLNTTLQQIPAAATAAGYNLKQFTEELTATASQIAQQTGAPLGQVAATISSISATTGLSPQQAGSLDTMQNTLMAAGYTGKNPWDIMDGTQGQALLARPMKIYETLLKGLGFGSVDQWQQAYYHGTRAQMEQARKALFRLQQYYSTPGGAESVGNIQPLQMMHMIGQAGSSKALLNQTHILDALSDTQSLTRGAKTPAQMDAKIERLLSQYFPGNASRTAHILEQFKKQAPHQRTPADLATMAAALLKSYSPYDRRQQANKTIGLTPEARKLVTLMQADAAHANSGGVTGFARSAGGLFSNVVTGNWGGAASDTENLAKDAVDWF